MQDDKFSRMVYEIDDIIAELSVKYKIDPLSLTSIILARLVLTNDYAGSGDDFRKILSNVPDRHISSNEVIH